MLTFAHTNSLVAWSRAESTLRKLQLEPPVAVVPRNSTSAMMQRPGRLWFRRPPGSHLEAKPELTALNWHSVERRVRSFADRNSHRGTSATRCILLIVAEIACLPLPPIGARLAREAPFRGAVIMTDGIRRAGTLPEGRTEKVPLMFELCAGRSCASGSRREAPWRLCGPAVRLNSPMTRARRWCWNSSAMAKDTLGRILPSRRSHPADCRRSVWNPHAHHLRLRLIYLIFCGAFSWAPLVCSHAAAPEVASTYNMYVVNVTVRVHWLPCGSPEMQRAQFCSHRHSDVAPPGSRDDQAASRSA